MSEFRCRRCGRDLDTGMRCWTIGCPGDSVTTHSTIDTHGVVYSPDADARRRAEEALAAFDRSVPSASVMVRGVKALDCVVALRALLAAEQSAPYAPPALPPEVHEAAERVRKHFHVFPPSPDEILTPFGEDVADLLSALSHSATVAGAPSSWPERHGSGLRAACGTPENWPQCVAGDWIETMVQTAGWVCGKCGHQPEHPCHNGAEKPHGSAPPAAPAGFDPECPRCLRPLSDHYPDQNNDPVCGDSPTPPAPDAVREAAERLRAKMREAYEDHRYMNVWATAQERLGPYTGPNWIAEAEALDAALAAQWAWRRRK